METDLQRLPAALQRRATEKEANERNGSERTFSLRDKLARFRDGDQELKFEETDMSHHHLDHESFHMTFVKNFGVSSLSASLAHVPHHPLYTLKSQMMFHGKKFRFTNFFARSWQTRGRFLFQGE